MLVYDLSYRCCLYNNHQAKDCIDSFVTHCVRVRTTAWVVLILNSFKMDTCYVRSISIVIVCICLHMCIRV